MSSFGSFSNSDLQEYSLNSWMSSLSSMRSLSELTIPGTHQSCGILGASFPINYIVDLHPCQHWNLSQQLNNGIRFIDIRIRHYHDQIYINHEFISQELTFNDIQEICYNFLNDHPTECIIMLIFQELHSRSTHNTRSLADTFLASTRESPRYSDMWWLGRHVPRLGDVRGRVVLLRRFALDPSHAEPWGIDVRRWADNRTFEIPIPMEVSVPLSPLVPLQFPRDAPETLQSLLVQDLYSPPTPVVGAKLDAVCALLEIALSDSSSDHFYVNYLSAAPPVWTALHWCGVFTPWSIAQEVEPAIEAYLIAHNEAKSQRRNARLGVLMMDFPTLKLCETIIDFNFHDAPR